jgi:hypothetical protein
VFVSLFSSPSQTAPEAMSDTSKPRILVLGGVGMIGRNFVQFCIDNDLCSYIRVADKTMPEIAYFRFVLLARRKRRRPVEFTVKSCASRSPEHKAAFGDERVKYVQADLTREAHLERAFNPEFAPYHYVYNLAGETKCGLTETVYASKVRSFFSSVIHLISASDLWASGGYSAVISPSSAVRSFSREATVIAAQVNSLSFSVMPQPRMPRNMVVSLGSVVTWKCRPRLSTSRRRKPPPEKAASCNPGRCRPSTSSR